MRCWLGDSRSSVATYILHATFPSHNFRQQQIDQILKSCRTTDVIEARQQRENLQKLAQFQLACVKHAMAFPSVLRVSYSTCSVNEEENEEVVRRVLEACPDFDLIRALPLWPRRGHALFPSGARPRSLAMQ